MEPRILYSAAPVDAAPEAEVTPTETAAAAAPVPVTQQSPAPATASPTAVQTVTEESHVAPEASGETEISTEQSVELIELDPQHATLTQETLQSIANAAAQRWRDSGISAEQSAALDSISYSIGSLNGATLGSTDGANITIDNDAAGFGWFLDQTPQEDSEFASGSDAFGGRYDLLTVLLHEQGHVLGLDESAVGSGGVMHDAIAAGQRRLPVAGEAATATATAGQADSEHLLVAGSTQVWQVGIDNDGTSEFEQEGGNNAAPGSATDRDDDYYFAGTYPDPIGVVLVDEPFNDGDPDTRVAGFERALTNGDLTNRIHFNLPTDQLGNDFFLEIDLVSTNQSTGGPIPFRVLFNGVEVHNDTAPAGAKYIVTPVFSGYDVNATTGDNVLTIVRDPGVGWMQFDYIRLSTTTTSVGVNSSGDLIIADNNGGVSNDNLTLSIDGTDYVVTDAGNNINRRISMASVTGKIIVNGGGGDDTLTVDLTGGDLGNALEFNGGVGGTDTIEIIDSSGLRTFTDATFNYVNSSDGSINIAGSSLITYTGLEPIASTINATNVTLTYNPAIAETITVTDNGATITVNSTAGEITTFNKPSGSFTINASADDVVEFTNALVIGADLEVNAGTVNVTATGSIDNSAAASPLIAFNVDTIDLAGAVNAGTGRVEIAPQTAGRAIHFGDDVIGEMSLSDAEVDFITAGVLQVGNTLAGAITFGGTANSGLITPANVNTLHLITAEYVEDGADDDTGGGIRIANLAIEAGGAALSPINAERSINLNNTNAAGSLVRSDIGTFAAISTVGRIVLNDYDHGVGTVGLIIGEIDGVAGVTNNTPAANADLEERIDIHTLAGDLTITDTSAAFDVQAGRDVFLRASGNTRAIIVDAGATIGHVVGGNLTLQADNIDLNGFINSPGRVVVLRSDDNNETINLGGEDIFGDNALEISDAELDNITSSQILIGHADYASAGAGAITITSAINPANASQLRLSTHSTVTQNAGATLTSLTHLGVQARRDVTLTEDNDIATAVAIDVRTANAATSGNIAFNNIDANGWIIDGAASTANVMRTDNGNIMITSVGTVSVDENNPTTGTGGPGLADTLVELRALKKAGSAASILGDITFNIGTGSANGADFTLNAAVDGNLDTTDVEADGNFTVNLLDTGDARINLDDSSTVNISAGGNIVFNVNGAGNTNSGIYLHGGHTLTAGGDITFTVQADGGQFLTNFDDSLPVTVISNLGTFTVTADRWTVNSNTVIDISGQTLLVSPFQAGDSIRLGDTTGTVGALRISNDELGTITGAGGTLTLGVPATNDISVVGNITLGVDTVFAQTAGNTIFGDGFTVNSGANAQTYLGRVEIGNAASADQATNTAGSVNYTTTTVFTADILGNGGGAPVAGTHHDQLVVNGIVNLGNADLDLRATAALTTIGGEKFVLITNDGGDAVNGTFNGLAEGSIVTLNVAGEADQLFSISYVGGDGNDVELTALGVATTTITLSGSTLRIEDTAPNATNDNLTIFIDGSDLVVRDPGNNLGSLVNGSVQTSADEVRIALSLFTDLVIDTLGGNDHVTVGDMVGFGGNLTINTGDGLDRIFHVGQVVLTGTGAAEYNAEQVEIYTGSRLETDSGNITLNGTGGGGSFSGSGVFIAPADIISSDGNIAITGQGGDTGIGNVGVTILIDLASSTPGQITTGGTISITGTGGGAGAYAHGIEINGGAITSTSAAATAISLTGNGGVGGNADYSNSGITAFHSTISAVNGGVVIAGNGDSSTTSNYNAGVSLYATRVLGTTLGVTGTGGGGGSHNRGIFLSSGSDLDATAGDATLIGSSAANNTNGSYNDGIYIEGSSVDASGMLTLMGTGSTSPTNSSNNSGVHIYNSTTTGGAGLDIDGVGGTGSGGYNYGVNLYSSTATGGTGATTIDGSANSSTAGYFNVGASIQYSTVQGATLDIVGLGGGGSWYNRGVMTVGGSLTATTGDLDIDGASANNNSGGYNDGVYLQSTTTTAGGLLTIDGSGSTGAANTTANNGVYLYGGVANGTGGVMVTGIGGTGSGGYNTGTTVFYTGISGGSNEVSISGTADSSTVGYFNVGANVQYAAITGSGITVTGTGGGGSFYNRGAQLTGGSFTASTGDIVITGTTDAGTSGAYNEGINASSISITSAGGSVSLTGTAVAAGANTYYNHGVHLTSVTANGAAGTSVVGNGGTGSVGWNTGITAYYSNLGIGTSVTTITGIANAAALGSYNIGTSLQYTTVIGSTLTVNGTGGAGASNNIGIQIMGGSATATGALIINGQTNNGTTGSNNHGVDIQNATIGGLASTSITGDGGGGFDYNHGIYMNGITAFGVAATTIGTKGDGANSEDENGNFF